MTYLCTGSNTTKAVNRQPIPSPSLPRLEQLNWRYETAECMDCGHRLDLTGDRSPRSNRQVLPMHYEDGNLFERAIQQALSVTITPETAARHLAAIEKETARG